MLSYGPRVWQFTIIVLSVTDRKGLNRSALMLRHERGDRTRIQAAAEKHSKRNIAHEMGGHCAFQQTSVPVHVEALRPAVILPPWLQVPIFANPHTPAITH